MGWAVTQIYLQALLVLIAYHACSFLDQTFECFALFLGRLLRYCEAF